MRQVPSSRAGFPERAVLLLLCLPLLVGCGGDRVIDPPDVIAPAAPTNLTAMVSETTVQLAWTHDAINTQGYKLERRSSIGSWSGLVEVGAGLTTYTDAQLSPASAYSYRVRAYNQAAMSGYSNEVQAIIPESPRAPSVTTGRVEILNSLGAIIPVTVMPNGAPTSAWLEFGTEPTLAAGDSTFKTDNVSGTFTKFFRGTTGTLYYYRAVARNEKGTARGEILTTVIGPPVAAPSAFSAEVKSDRSIVLRWNPHAVIAANQGAVSWSFYFRTPGTLVWHVGGLNSVGDSIATMSRAPIPENDLEFSIGAMNQYGRGPWAGPITLTGLAAAAAGLSSRSGSNTATN